MERVRPWIHPCPKPHFCPYRFQCCEAVNERSVTSLLVTDNQESENPACREGQVNRNRQAVTKSIVFTAVFLEPRRIPGTEGASNNCFIK